MLKRLINLAIELWAQKVCLVRGHSAVSERGQDETFLRCARCLRRSDGWRIEPKALVFVKPDPPKPPAPATVAVIPYVWEAGRVPVSRDLELQEILGDLTVVQAPTIH